MLFVAGVLAVAPDMEAFWGKTICHEKAVFWVSSGTDSGNLTNMVLRVPLVAAATKGVRVEGAEAFSFEEDRDGIWLVATMKVVTTYSGIRMELRDSALKSLDLGREPIALWDAPGAYYRRARKIEQESAVENCK